MSIFKLSMAFHKIALALDDENFNKIKPYLDEIEKGMIELVEDATSKEKQKEI